MKISQKQLKRIILSEIQNMPTHQNESDDSGADDADAAEGVPMEERYLRIPRRKLLQIIREEYGEDYLSVTAVDSGGEESDPSLDFAEPEHKNSETDHVVHHHHHYHHHDNQGYDAREDERLAAEHGSESAHDQDYKDRRDDAGFEVRHENKLTKARLHKIIKEEILKLRK